MRGKLKFEYRLTYEECYETFYLLSRKWGRTKGIVLTSVLTAIAVVMLILYYRDRRGVHYFFLSVLTILVLTYLIYMPVLKAKKGAKNVSRQNGLYRIELTGDGRIKSGKEVVDLKGDEDARVIETDMIFAIRPDRIHTFCIPKRILSKEEIMKVRESLNV